MCGGKKKKRKKMINNGTLIRSTAIAANRLLTAMVIEMKNEISQTVRHCQAQAIINKLKDEHTL